MIPSEQLSFPGGEIWTMQRLLEFRTCTVVRVIEGDMRRNTSEMLTGKQNLVTLLQTMRAHEIHAVCIEDLCPEYFGWDILRKIGDGPTLITTCRDMAQALIRHVPRAAARLQGLDDGQMRLTTRSIVTGWSHDQGEYIVPKLEQTLPFDRILWGTFPNCLFLLDNQEAFHRGTKRTPYWHQDNSGSFELLGLYNDGTNLLRGAFSPSYSSSP